MLQFPVEDASKRLPQLIREANSGEDIILTENSLPVAKLVSIPFSQGGLSPRHGRAKGIILHMASDFDAPLADFKDYTE